MMQHEVSPRLGEQKKNKEEGEIQALFLFLPLIDAHSRICLELPRSKEGEEEARGSEQGQGQVAGESVSDYLLLYVYG